MVQVDKWTIDVLHGKTKIQVRFAKMQAALSVPVWMVDAMMVLDSAKDKEQYLPVTGGRFLPADSDFPGQTGQNDFVVWEGQRPGFSCQLPGLSIIDFWRAQRRTCRCTVRRHRKRSSPSCCTQEK